MRPDYSYMSIGLKRYEATAAARGFALVSAIFLLVILAALGGFMMHFSMVQHMTSAQDVKGSRAYQAARAGMEWAAYEVMHNAGSACAAPTILQPLAGSLADFTVQVQCTPVQESEGTVANNLTFYRIVSTATFGTSGNVNFVQRRIQGLVEK